MFSFRQKQQVDRYHIAAVTVVEELSVLSRLPLEIRYVLAKRPERMSVFRSLLEAGYGIGIRTVDRTPERVLQAVDRVSHVSQENTVLPWLPLLLREGQAPSFSKQDLEQAATQGVNLYEEIKLIMERRYEFKKIVLIDLHNRGLQETERTFIREINEDLYPLSVDYIVNRVLFDNAHTRTEVAQNILKALIVIGPIAHVLEHVARGIGKVFAASVDDLLSEVAELFALRGSGFGWRELAKRSRILVPIFLLALWGAFSVEGFIERGQLGRAGVLFGLSAVALSLTTAVQSIGLYHRAYQRLRDKGSLPASVCPHLWRLALRQDFTNPARLGLFLGAFASPCLAALIFTLFSSWTHNGWVLALLGSVESLVAGATVIAASRLNRWRFHRRIQGEIGALQVKAPLV